MTDEPYVGEYRWQGEPQNSPVELWNGKEWVLVSALVAPSDSAARDIIQRLANALEKLDDHYSDQLFDLLDEARSYLAQHP